MSCHTLFWGLFMKLGEIKSLKDFSEAIGVPLRSLTYVLYGRGADSYYSEFEIPKKSGGVRVISAPNGRLKDIQKKIASLLYAFKEDIEMNNNVENNISQGFEKGKSIITNAQIHRNKKYVLNIDLSNFFDSFHFGRVMGYFEKNNNIKMPKDMAIVMAQLTCYQGKLPQGAPTSPIITNLICQILDYKILSISKKYRLNYTRYADDLTFSTNDKKFLETYQEFLLSITRLVEKNGFTVNQKKVRLQYYNSQQKVTGLVVNKRINIDKNYYKQTRAMANHLYKNGYYIIDGTIGKTSQLEGRLSFINQIEKYNNRFNGITKNCHNLNGKERETQKFLFFKYFFNHDKPLILTEGKTDVLYIKAALKNMFQQYPELVEKNDEGDYLYKISFLKRSKRLQFYFGLSEYGADTYTPFKNYLINEKSFGKQNIYDYFQKITERKPKNPVVFVFDNEMCSTKQKPVKKFLCKAMNYEECKEGFHFRMNYNMFVASHSLKQPIKEGCIEDLFTQETRGHVINGKSLSLDDQYDAKKYYGKDEFSKYVYNNFKNIDFSGFVPLLNHINSCIQEYGVKR